MQYYICFILGQKMIRDKIQHSIANRPEVIVRMGRILGKNNKVRVFLKNLYVYAKESWQDYRNAKFVAASPYRKEIEKVRDFLLKNN